MRSSDLAATARTSARLSNWRAVSSGTSARGSPISARAQAAAMRDFLVEVVLELLDQGRHAAGVAVLAQGDRRLATGVGVDARELADRLGHWVDDRRRLPGIGWGWGVAGWAVAPLAAAVLRGYGTGGL